MSITIIFFTKKYLTTYCVRYMRTSVTKSDSNFFLLEETRRVSNSHLTHV